MKNIKFKKWDCYLWFGQYENGRTAIALKEHVTHEIIAKATVNIDEFQLPPGDVLIKNWSENEGMVDALIDAGIIDHPHATVATGHVDADLCKLLIDPVKYVPIFE